MFYKIASKKSTFSITIEARTVKQAYKRFKYVARKKIQMTFATFRKVFDITRL